MVDKPQAVVQDIKPIEAGATPPPPPKRHPGHRNTDVRDTVAEMAARAQEISQEAGSKVAQAMKDVIGAAAGLAGFAVESARDLVQYMVRRGQMTQDEADKLMREAEEAHSKKKPPASTEPKKAAAPAVAAKAPPKPAFKPAPKPPAKAPARPAPKAVAKAVPKAAAKPARAAAKPTPKKKAPPAPARAKSSSKKAAGKKKR